MGMLFQSSALFTDLSVFENVAFPLRVHTNLPDEMIRDLVLMKLNSVGLRGARDLMPSQLSRRDVAARRTGPHDRARSEVHHVRRAVHPVRTRSQWACWYR
jgi:ABC-type sugar transport system ATPase subunit